MRGAIFFSPPRRIDASGIPAPQSRRTAREGEKHPRGSGKGVGVEAEPLRNVVESVTTGKTFDGAAADQALEEGPIDTGRLRMLILWRINWQTAKTTITSFEIPSISL